jgi:putative ABC transport system permease protein
MPLHEAIRLALDTIRIQKLKSFFTLLGVMISVMFLIAVVSIVEGMSRYVKNDFASKLIGVNTYDFRSRPVLDPNQTDESTREYLRRPRIFAPEVELVRSTIPPGSHAAITSQNSLIAVGGTGRPWQVDAVATEADYFQIKTFGITNGRAFTPQEVHAGSRVLVIGVEVAEHFFPDVDPVGRELRLQGTPYGVIGVIEKQGSVFGFSMDRLAIAPWTTPLQRALRPRGDIGSLLVQAPSPGQVEEGIEAAREVLRGARHLPPGRPDNFALETQDSAMAFFEELEITMVVVGTALPAIGLIVGALVIMNIMLVAVAERTREIGIRKALGATRGNILSQFLVEATTLSVIGAAIGIGLGLATAKVVAAFTPLPAAVAPWSIFAALAMGAGVGITAGVYPAGRAARLDPIAALRQE